MNIIIQFLQFVGILILSTIGVMFFGFIFGFVKRAGEIEAEKSYGGKKND